MDGPANSTGDEKGLRGLMKSLVRRAIRPAVWDLRQSLARIESSIAELKVQSIGARHEGLRGVSPPAVAQVGAVWRGGIAGSAFSPDGSLDHRASAKYRDELAYWVAAARGQDPSLRERFEATFIGWQKTRLNELADRLGIDRDGAMDDWCRGRDVVEIGGGPIPCCAVRPFRSAAAVDPLADGYVSAGVTPAWVRDRGILHIAACGERVPLAGGSADLVIAENCLDHTDDPRLVVAEISRVLRPGGLLWLLVDLMDYTDHMHPNPMSESRLDALLLPHGFSYRYKQSWEGASHPMAKVQLRALLNKVA